MRKTKRNIAEKNSEEYATNRCLVIASDDGTAGKN